MIRRIDGIDLSSLSMIERDIFYQRCEIFANRLGWDVNVENDLEIDEFDGRNTLYLVSCDPLSGEVHGSLRMLPTTQPHMMSNQFAPMFPDLGAVTSPLIWECTRFCAYKERGPGKEYENTNISVGQELLVGMVETALSSGITQILGMFERKMRILYNRAGIHPDILGETEFDDQHLMVGLMTISPESLQAMRDKLNLHVSVLDDGNYHDPEFDELPMKKTG